MNLRPVLILASKNKAIANSLKNYVKLFLGEQLQHRLSDTLVLTCIEELYETLNHLNREEIFNAMVVYDSISNFSQSNVTELVLRYPEVYWVFVSDDRLQLKNIYGDSIPDSETETPDVKDPKKSKLEREIIEDFHNIEYKEIKKLISLIQRHANGFRTYFDPTGFRWLIENYQNKKKVTEIKSKPQFGASIDEETNFSLFNGYLLYRFGYCTYVVSSYSETKETLRCKNENSGEDHSKCVSKFTIVMEDISLKFPDLNNQEGIERALFCEDEDVGILEYLLERRKRQFCELSLENPESNRIIVTCSNNNLEDDNKLVIRKPFGGIFDRDLRNKHPEWFETKVSVSSDDGLNSHAASGFAQHIAEGLLLRSRKIAKEADSVEEAVHAAFLAEEAKRLLGGKTLSLSLEALKLKQSMEVTAECAFVGTSQAFDVDQRFNEIEQEVGKISGSDMQKYSSLVEITDDLRQIYRNFEQFDQEETALTKVREYRWDLKFLPKGFRENKEKKGLVKIVGKNPNKILERIKEIKKNNPLLFKKLRGMSSLFTLYFYWLIESFMHILFALGYWIVVFSIFYYPYFRDPKLSLEFSALTFFEMQPAFNGFNESSMSLYFNTVLFSEVFIAFSHLGIFVTYLYQKISRK